MVGDPEVQLLEGLAGALVDELAAIEHEAEPGEIVLAASARASLGTKVHIGERGVLLESVGAVDDVPWPDPAEAPDDLDLVRPWLLPSVCDRLAAGEGEFLAELRPATALFLRFSGIEFEADPQALERLDELDPRGARVLREYEGTLVQLTIGDKGSYLYAAFGAPVAHEDDSRARLLAALELRALGRGQPDRAGLDRCRGGSSAGRCVRRDRAPHLRRPG